MATIKNKLKSSKDLYAEGLSNAATAANNAGGIAAKEARAAKEAQISLTSEARDFYRQVRLGGEI